MDEHGNYEMKGKKLVNLKTGENENDAVTLGHVNTVLNDRIGYKAENNSLSMHNRNVCDVATPVNENDAVNLSFLRNNTLINDQKSQVIDAKSSRIANVGDFSKETDAINAKILFSRGLVNSVQIAEDGNLEDSYNAENRRIRNIKGTLYENDAVTAKTLFETLKVVQKLITLELCELGVILRKEIHNLRDKQRSKEEVKRHLNSIEASLDRNWRKALHVSQNNKAIFTYSDVEKLPDLPGLDAFFQDYATRVNSSRDLKPKKKSVSAS